MIIPGSMSEQMNRKRKLRAKDGEIQFLRERIDELEASALIWMDLRRKVAGLQLENGRLKKQIERLKQKFGE